MFPWRKITVWLLIGIAVTAICIPLFHLEENWRGKLAWERCQRALAARGEALDWNAYIPEPVADDDNILKAPRMTEWFVRDLDKNTTNSLSEDVRVLRSTTRMPLPIPIAELSPDSARNYLAKCQRVEADLDLIASGLQRPVTHFDADYHDVLIVEHLTVNFVTLRVLAQTLALRTRCFLVLGQPESALRDLTILHNLDRLLKGKPGFLVTTMINVAVKGLYLETINQGLQLHLWRDSDLQVLQKQLAEIDLVPGLQAAVREERAGVLHLFQPMKESEWAKMFDEYGDPGKKRSKVPSSWRARGALYHNLVVFSEIEQEFIDVFPTNHIVDPARMDAVQLDVNNMLKQPSAYNALAQFVLPNLKKATQTTVRNQAIAEITRVACALERYQLAHGQYPENLDSLVSDLIDSVPVDIIGGRPLRYERTAGGTFTLYSIGWNGKDDGGEVVSNADDVPVFDRGDWVWPMGIH